MKLAWASLGVNEEDCGGLRVPARWWPAEVSALHCLRQAKVRPAALCVLVIRAPPCKVDARVTDCVSTSAHEELSCLGGAKWPRPGHVRLYVAMFADIYCVRFIFQNGTFTHKYKYR